MASTIDDIPFESFLQTIRSGKSLQRPSSQPVAQTSVSDAGNLAETRDWFSSPQNNPIKPPAIATSPRRRPSTQNPNPLNELLLTPPRSDRHQHYITRSEFLQTIRAITDRFDEFSASVQGALRELRDELRNMQRKVDTVMSNHEELSTWTMDVSNAMSDMARHVVGTGTHIPEAFDWQMPGGGVQP